jgi:CRISPR-associated protein Csa3
VYKPIAEFGAKKVVLIYSKDDEEYTSEEDFKKIDVALNKAKELCNMLGIDCEEVEVKGMEFEKNVEIFRELMQNENNRIIVNITGGRKITSFALLYASLYEFQKIDKIVYVHNKRIVEFPKIAHPYNLTKFERKILSSLNEGEKTITDLAKEFNVSLPAIVKYINSLEQKKLVKTHKIGRKRIVNII